MLLKIKGHNQERFEETVKAVMNLACVAFRKGSIPTEREMQEPEKRGLFWYENAKEERFELVPISHNHRAFIRQRGENFIVVKFYSRYQGNRKQVESLSNLILSLFSEDEVELVALAFPRTTVHVHPHNLKMT